MVVHIIGAPRVAVAGKRYDERMIDSARRADTVRRVKVEVVVEVPKLSFVKRRPDGSIDFVSPFPCPFNYGSVPDTESPDGDPMDAVLLGPRLPAGTRAAAERRGVVCFVDDGQEDPKLILSPRPLRKRDVVVIRAFFEAYAVLKRALNRARGRRGITKVRGYEGLESVW